MTSTTHPIHATTTHHVDFDFVAEATSRASIHSAALDWLWTYTQRVDEWTVEVIEFKGPGGDWPVVRFGHSDREMVEGLVELYEGMS